MGSAREAWYEDQETFDEVRTKITVEKETYDDIGEICGTADQIADFFIDLAEQVAEDYPEVDPSQVEFFVRQHYSGADLYIRYDRYETDEEVSQRLQKEAKAARRRLSKEEKERAEYERLRAIYGE